jgi:hypothetical protein
MVERITGIPLHSLSASCTEPPGSPIFTAMHGAGVLHAASLLARVRAGRRADLAFLAPIVALGFIAGTLWGAF